MNSRTAVWLVAVGVVAACGRPPSPESPAAAPRATTPTSTTTAPTTTTQPTTSRLPPTTVVVPEPHHTTTTAAPPPPPPEPEPKPPPPPPEPPDRWVLRDDLRKSIEERTGQPFADVWSGIAELLIKECPHHDAPCVGHDLRVDETFVSEQDCVVAPGGIVVPDPLHEGDKIIFYVNNDRCPEV